MNIWNPFIQQLVKTNDVSSIRLAFHLCSDKHSMGYWFISMQETTDSLGLPWLPYESKVGSIYDEEFKGTYNPTNSARYLQLIKPGS